ncbi:MAG: carboxyl-terminal processing protease [Rhodothermales bacterium]|jgi:carboxyl-terminal processing protease
MRRKTLVILCPLLGAALFWSGFQTARDDDFYAMRKNFELFGAVYEQVVGSYMVRVDPERFMRTGMDAMLGTLDPWTDFLDEADNVAMELRGQDGLSEVDINLGTRNGRITVLAPDALTGAYAQGVRTGDVVESVAGQPAEELPLAQVFQLLRGEPNTAVEMVVRRAVEGEMTFMLKRVPPVVAYVSYAGRVADSKYALVKLDAFGPGTSREIDNALEDVEEGLGSDLEGIILDLRGNPGGLVSEAISLVGLFVPKDTPVVSTRGKSPEANRLYATGDDPDWGDVNLVILVDEGSASASEIVSGALQDLDRAVILGETTFGKGLVQVVRAMPYHTALKMTYSRYFTPAGRGIRKDAESGGAPMQDFRTTNGRTVREGNGIEPDVLLASAKRSPLETALLREAAYFRFAGYLVTSEGEQIRAASQRAGAIQLPGDALERFRTWLSDQQFSFESDLTERIDALEALNAPGAQGPVQALRLLTTQAEEEAFDEAGDRILEGIQTEVAARLLDPAQRIQQALDVDESLIEAVDVLQSGRYAALLGN